jgi:CBS domain containing-hemolysin-like protein
MIFLFLLLFCVAVEAFFAMFEMAIVSFNRVRLHYYLFQKYKRAKWLESLLNKPSYLFGTTLIAISTVQQLGSELARRFYESLNLSPDFAPFTQVFIILIFGELAPMFAARRYSEHAALLSVPIVYFVSKLLSPLIWLIELLSKLISKKSESYLELSKAEIKKVLEEQDSVGHKSDNISTITSNILSLKDKKANQMMAIIDSFHVIHDTFTIEQTRELLRKKYSPFILVHIQNSLAIVFPQDLLMAPGYKLIKEFIRSPWCVSENTSVLSILKESRQEACIILDRKGHPCGVITIAHIIDTLFGKSHINKMRHTVIEKKLSAEMSLTDFNRQFNVTLEYANTQNLSELINAVLGHQPMKNDSIYVGQFELIVIEPSLTGTKTVLVRTLPF